MHTTQTIAPMMYRLNPVTKNKRNWIRSSNSIQLISNTNNNKTVIDQF